jgi:hypothetical protein
VDADESGAAPGKVATAYGWLAYLLFVTLLLFAGGRIVTIMNSQGLLAALLVVVACIPVILVVAVIHQLAYLLAALIVRLRVTEIPMPFFRLTGEKGRLLLRLRWRRSWLPEELYTVPVVPLGKRALLLRVAVVAAAPALVSLPVVIGCLLLPSAVNPAANPGAAWLTPLLPPQESLTAVCHIAAACLATASFLGAIPLRGKDGRTDGDWVVDCLQRQRHVLRDLALGALAHGLRTGVRPRDWEPALVAYLQTEEDSSAQEVLVDLFRYYHALDRGEIDLAGRFLDHALASNASPNPYGPVLALEAAYFEGFHYRHAGPARLWLEQVPVTADRAMRCRGEAAVLFAEHRLAEALKRTDAGLALLRRDQVDGDWLEAIQRRCQQERNDTAITPARGAMETAVRGGPASSQVGEQKSGDFQKEPGVMHGLARQTAPTAFTGRPGCGSISPRSV